MIFFSAIRMFSYEFYKNIFSDNALLMKSAEIYIRYLK